jgi:hypothetical protein
MRKSFFLLTAAVFFTAHTLTAQRKIQVALLLDTSNSMDGLIEQAKTQLWSIVNEMATARADGKIPDIQIALYEYGNDRLSAEGNYIRQVVPLTSDLDKISQELFALRTNGGNEFCGAVIGKSIQESGWSSSPRDLKLIYIAGNEPFNQGRIDFKTTCAAAIRKGIVVNTIFCGDYQEGVRSFWKEGADLADGKYLNIDPNQTTVFTETPFDSKINELNGKLNETYIAFGAGGSLKKENQTAQDVNAAVYSPAAAAERTISKSSSAYRADDWDLVDAVKNQKVKASELNVQDLPEEYRGKSATEIKAMVEKKSEERTRIQNEIQTLSVKRQEFIQAKAKESGQTNTLNAAMSKAMRERAMKLGFTFPNP